MLKQCEISNYKYDCNRGNGSLNSTLTLAPWFGSNYWLPQNGTYSYGWLTYGILGYINGSVLQSIRPISVTILVVYNKNTTGTITSTWVQPEANLAPMPRAFVNVSMFNNNNYTKDVHSGNGWASVTSKLLNTTSHVKDYHFTFPFWITFNANALNRTNHNFIDFYAVLNGLDKNVSAKITLTVVDLWE